MKKILVLLITVCLVAWPLLALAAPNVNTFTGQVAGQAGYATNVTDTSLSQAIGGVIRVILGLTGVIFLVLTVYAGFLWMTASGEKEKIEKAQGIIKTSIIGLVVVIAAYSITYFVVGQLGTVTSGESTVGGTQAEPSGWQRWIFGN